MAPKAKHTGTLAGGVRIETGQVEKDDQEMREDETKESYFAGPFDALPDAEVAGEPDGGQRADQFPAQAADILQSGRDLQHPASASGGRDAPEKNKRPNKRPT